MGPASSIRKHGRDVTLSQMEHPAFDSSAQARHWGERRAVETQCRPSDRIQEWPGSSSAWHLQESRFTCLSLALCPLPYSLERCTKNGESDFPAVPSCAAKGPSHPSRERRRNCQSQARNS